VLLAAYGAEERVASIIGSALLSANRASAPKGPRELLTFVKACVLPLVSADLGPRIAMAMLDEIAAELALENTDAFDVPFPGGESASHERAAVRSSPAPAHTLPPVSGARARPSVLFADANRFQRAAIARALVTDGYDVRVSETSASLASELASNEPLHLVVLDVEHPQVESLLERIVEARPELPVVAMARAYGPAAALLRAAGVDAFDVRLKDAPMEELVDLIRRLVRG
jgi:PleD family two-component response regulator